MNALNSSSRSDARRNWRAARLVTAFALAAVAGAATLAVPGLLGTDGVAFAKRGADDGAPVAGGDDGTPDQGHGDAPGTPGSGGGRGPGGGGGAGGGGHR